MSDEQVALTGIPVSFPVNKLSSADILALVERDEERENGKTQTTKGGRGSGHHQHAGRPGKRGGSAPGKGGINNSVSREEKINRLRQTIKNDPAIKKNEAHKLQLRERGKEIFKTLKRNPMNSIALQDELEAINRELDKQELETVKVVAGLIEKEFGARIGGDIASVTVLEENGEKLHYAYLDKVQADVAVEKVFKLTHADLPYSKNNINIQDVGGNIGYFNPGKRDTIYVPLWFARYRNPDSHSQVGTAIHELGHLIEFSKTKMGDTRTSDFYDEQTQGEEIKTARGGYDYRRDKFLNNYMGRDYGGKNRGTEVFSVGVETLFTSPLKLVWQPTLFNFTVDYLTSPAVLETTKGGRGSGHHQHAGRPGKRGGSAPGKGGINPQLSPSNERLRNVAYLSLKEIKGSLSVDGIEGYNDDLARKLFDNNNLLGMYAFLSDDKRRDIKDNLVSKISERSGVDYETVNKLIFEWANTASFSDDARITQATASQEFGIEPNEFASENLSALLNPDFYIVNIEEFRDSIKDDVQSAVEKTLPNLISSERWEGGEKNKYTTPKAYWESVVHGAVNDAYIRDMAKKSGIDFENDEKVEQLRRVLMGEFSHALFSIVVQQEIGVPPFALSLGQYDYTISNSIRMQKNLYQKFLQKKDGVGKVLRAMYDVTQETLAEKGFKPDDKIVLFRGTRGYGQSEHGSEFTAFGNPVSSWSLGWGVAQRFAEKSDEEIIAAEVPIKNILSLCTTGFGCANEIEVTILGHPVDGITVSAPQYEGQTTKGGKGSGHHRHAGRPGKHGGSLPGGAGASTLPIGKRDLAGRQKAFAPGGDGWDLVSGVRKKILSNPELIASHERRGELVGQAEQILAQLNLSFETTPPADMSYGTDEELDKIADELAQLDTDTFHAMAGIIAEEFGMMDKEFPKGTNLTGSNTIPEVNVARRVARLWDESVTPEHGVGITDSFPHSGYYNPSMPDVIYVPLSFRNLMQKHYGLFNKSLMGAPSSVVHEIGHMLEDNKVRHGDSTLIDFYNRRTAGEDILTYNPMGGSSSSFPFEYRKDKFFDIYMGRDYPHTDFCEVFSMGSERLFSDPIRLAEDPELFDFTLGYLVSPAMPTEGGELSALLSAFKGGRGSGHHRHAGRPGKHGGSLPGKGGIAMGLSRDEYIKIVDDFRSTREAAIRAAKDSKTQDPAVTTQQMLDAANERRRIQKQAEKIYRDDDYKDGELYLGYDAGMRQAFPLERRRMKHTDLGFFENPPSVEEAMPVLGKGITDEGELRKMRSMWEGFLKKNAQLRDWSARLFDLQVIESGRGENSGKADLTMDEILAANGAYIDSAKLLFQERLDVAAQVRKNFIESGGKGYTQLFRQLGISRDIFDASNRVRTELGGEFSNGTFLVNNLVLENDFVSVVRVMTAGEAGRGAATRSTARNKYKIELANALKFQGGRGLTLLHEFGHIFEENDPAVGAIVHDFLTRRTKGEVAVSLKTLTGDNYYKDEVAKPDKFVHPYMGKKYESIGTEIMSMGLQYLGHPTTAMELATKDPEMFDLVWTLAGIGNW